MPWFFSDEKNFSQNQKLDRRKDRWLCQTAEEFPIFRHSNLLASVMVQVVMSNEDNDGYVMPPHFFCQGLRVNTAVYTDVLDTVAKP